MRAQVRFPERAAFFSFVVRSSASLVNLSLTSCLLCDISIP